MALAASLAAALSEANLAMEHSKVHEDYAYADPASSPVPPSKRSPIKASKVFRPAPAAPPHTPPAAVTRSGPSKSWSAGSSPRKSSGQATTVAARRALRAAVEGVERRCARVEAVVASRLDALDARCAAIGRLTEKLVENAPTRACLEAVKMAKEAQRQAELARDEAQQYLKDASPLNRKRSPSLSSRLKALSPLKKVVVEEEAVPRVEEDALVAAYASYQRPEPPSTSHVPQDFDSIQAAIDAAEDGGLVVIAPGVYREALVVARAVQLDSSEFTNESDTIGAPPCAVTLEAPQPGARALLVTAAGNCDARGIEWQCCSTINETARPCAAVGVKGGRLAMDACIVGSDSALSGVNAQRGATLLLTRVSGKHCRHTGVLLSGAGTTASLERCDLSDNGAHGLEIQDSARVEDALHLRCANNALFGVFVSDGGSYAKLRRADLSRNRRCGVWVQSGAACEVSDASFSKNGEHGMALSEDKSAAVLRRCAFAGRDDHLACFNGAAFSALDARDCCYEPGDEPGRIEAGL